MNGDGTGYMQKTVAVKALLETTNNPLVMSNAAYELADAGQELPLDEEKVRTASEQLTKETESWMLDESPAVLKQKTSLLVASWDTMGWILYKEDRVREAASHIDAAWMNRRDAEVLKHHDALNPGAAGSSKSRTVQLPKSSLPVVAQTVQVTATAPARSSYLSPRAS